MDEFLEAQFTDYALVEEMYVTYQADPQSVDPSWRKFFESVDQGEQPEEVPEEAAKRREKREKEPIAVKKVVVSADGDTRIANVIDAYRTYGHLMASVDPIATGKAPEPRELSLATLGFKEEELERNFPTCGLLKEDSAPLKKIVEALRDIYCDGVGVEYMNVGNIELQKWLQERIEPTRFKIELTIDQKRMILQHLNKSELFESFLHTKYVGQKRFSLEGEETLIPMLDAIYEFGAQHKVEELIIGMAHRGRLNVLVNILNKSFKEVFGEFEDSYIPESVAGSGDVKYHKGYSSEVKTEAGPKVKISVTPNPSHLEAVDPVVEGQVFAKQITEGKEGVVPVLVHGDAAISGQGVVYETMQLGRLKGYSTGGTIHIVINNRIGFTTLPRGGRSTHYCTDIARTFDAPVFHVNAEDPESCVYATMLAVEMRQLFGCDVFIDLNGYRKYGHNETDEPAFTQPLEYQLIRKKKPIRELYRDYLVKQGVLERYMAETLEQEYKKALDRALKGAQVASEHKGLVDKVKGKNPEGFFAAVDTAVPLDTLRNLIKVSSRVPEGFNIHRKLGNLVEKRRKVAANSTDENSVDWALGEILAFGSLLKEGTDIRLSGQDSRRGTFSHRHGVWVDQKNAKKYFPLRHISKDQGRFDLYNSPLSEYGVLGFEYGYSISTPEALTIWEAQFGDFCNGAQVIIDQFIATGEQKWGTRSGLTLLLPHGFEGQGPEHSSARMERFINLSGNYNMQVTYPTTPAQLFHLLRRQVKRKETTPLIVFTPKGLLRHPKCVSSLKDLSDGHFQEIIDDAQASTKAKRVVFCSGRIYYDLIAGREKFKAKDMAIVRIEQLYPFHMTRMQEIIARYSSASSFFWVQEEPSNMGAWKSLRVPIGEALPKGAELKYIGRKPSASPATGSFTTHKKQLNELINAVFSSEEQPFYEMSYHTAPA